ncbi:MAG: peptidoglycan-binding protein [Pseudomonadota bacterium]
MLRKFALATALTICWAGHGMADGGVALVIGNGDYENAPDAQTAARDANVVADALEDAGWSVTKGINLERTTMREVIAQFTADMADADEVAIFYSGHALRTGGVSYMAPVDARADTLTDVMFDAVPLDLLLQIAAEKSGNAVLFVDGAQLRGFQPQEFVEPGLAALEGPEGVLIVSAAEPGRAVRRSRWRDSRFARLIIDQFLQPGAGVQQVADETEAPTFVVGSVDSEFTLAPSPVTADSQGLEREIELAYWRAAERSGKAEDYQAYLTRFPEGLFVAFARERLGLNPDGSPKEEEPKIDPRILAERDLNLSRIRKRKIQEYLLALGFDPRGIDGLFGRGSRNAIRRWQLQNGFDNEGWLTADQVEKLTTQGEAALAEQRRIAAEKRRIQEAEDNAYWSATGAKGKPAGYRTYLEKYPEGLHSKVARAALAKVAEAEADAQARTERRAFRRAKRADTAESYRDYLGAYPEGIYRDEALARLDEIEGAERAAADEARLLSIEDALGLSQDDRISVEQRLRYLGFEVGAEDGNFDNRTRAAIKGYQSARELEGTGYLNRPTVVNLVRDTQAGSNQQGGRVVIDGAQVIRGLLDALGN